MFFFQVFGIDKQDVLLPDDATAGITSTTFTLLQGIKSKSIQSNNKRQRKHQKQKIKTEGNFILEAKKFGKMVF